MQTQFIYMGFDGKRRETENYLFKLSYNPKELTGAKFDECTCKEFGLQYNSGEILTIPRLKNWRYFFDPGSGLGKGLVFGIPHDIFENIKESSGGSIPPEIRYAVYNNFVDFHALSDIFPRPLFGLGVENLKQIGDKVIHPGAHSNAPVNLGNTVKEGSSYCNGEITLELIGLSIVNNRPCALIKYDSGESTLNMSVTFPAGGNVETIGGSEYIGDIYIDLETGWIRKVTLDEFIITERKEPNKKEKIKRYTIRHLILSLISRKEFEKDAVLL